jgi:hypothetical protein
MRIASVLSFVSLVTICSNAHADLDLPHLSPGAKVGVTVGMTDIMVDYSSPAARGRKVWGGLVPYGQPWRTGANNTTKITFSKDVTIAGNAVAAGSYAIFTIPNAASWTVIFSKDVDKGGFTYHKESDLFRFDVKPAVGPAREHLTFFFPDFDDNSATLALEWDKVHVAFPIKAKTQEQVAKSLKGQMDYGWRPYAVAAKYILDAKGDMAQATTLVDQSITIKEDWWNVWIKAQILASQKKYKDALALAQKADTLGSQKPDDYFAAPDVKKALSDWKTKS